jgi:carbon-monoxide dehydrogenase medium subunit
MLLTLSTELHSFGPNGERSIPLSQFFRDAYTTALEPAELLKSVTIQVPARNSGGAYMAFKRCAPVYASASAAVHLTMAGRDNHCEEVKIYLGCVGLVPVHAQVAEDELRGAELNDKSIDRAAEAAMHAAEPPSDMRGSADYKKILIRSLVKKAIHAAIKRSHGEQVKVEHEYVGR